jgi:hypothetical protein
MIEGIAPSLNKEVNFKSSSNSSSTALSTAPFSQLISDSLRADLVVQGNPIFAGMMSDKKSSALSLFSGAEEEEDGLLEIWKKLDTIEEIMREKYKGQDR